MTNKKGKGNNKRNDKSKGKNNDNSEIQGSFASLRMTT
jgi:hypothetical protein